MSTNAEPATAVVQGERPAPVLPTNGDRNDRLETPSLTEALTLRRNLLQSLWIGVRQLPRGRRVVLMIRLCVSFAQIVAFIPVLALPGSHRVSPSHEQGRVCDPDSLFKYLVVHIVRLALDIPVELYLGLSPHRTRQGRRAGPEARAVAERDRPLGSEYLDVKVGKISTLLGIASLVIFFVGNAIVYSSTECSQRPAEAVPLFWAALASLIVVYIFIVEIAVLAFLIVCALPLLIMVLRALGLNHRLPQRELHPETGKIDQEEVDKRVKLVYYTPAEEDEETAGGKHGAEEAQATDTTEHVNAASPSTSEIGEAKQPIAGSDAASNRPGLGSRRATQDTTQSTSNAALGRFSRLTRLLVARRRSSASSTTRLGRRKAAATPPDSSAANAPQTEPSHMLKSAKAAAKSAKHGKLKYPLHPLPAHRATCPICLCDFEEPEPDQEPEPEPLRLLECGHVMHRSCVDQWLTTVSGRCPVCQKAVIPEMETRGEDATQAQEQGNAVNGQPASAVRDGAVAEAETDGPQTRVAESSSRAQMTEATQGGSLTEAQAVTATASATRGAEPADDQMGESHELQPLPSSPHRTDPTNL